MSDGTLREEILGKIHLAVRTELFNQYRKNMDFLADDLLAILRRESEKVRDEEWGKIHTFKQVGEIHGKYKITERFCRIGKRKGFMHKTQGTLFYDVARIIEAKRPKGFLLENVQGLVTHDGGRTLSTILEVLSELDYDVQYKILNAADFGVPQMRKRIYIVGIDRRLKGIDPSEFAFPDGNKENHANVGEYLEFGVEGYSISERLQKSYLYKLQDGRPKVLDKESKGPAKTLVASYHKIQRLTGTFVKDGPTGLRLYTENECKALMGFPKDFKVPVSRTQMYRQFGNSVVIPVITAVAKELKPFIVKGQR